MAEYLETKSELFEEEIARFVYLHSNYANCPRFKGWTHNMGTTYLEFKNRYHGKGRHQPYPRSLIKGQLVQWRYILDISNFLNDDYVIFFSHSTKARRGGAAFEAKQIGKRFPVTGSADRVRLHVPEAAQQYMKFLRDEQFFPLALIEIFQCLWLPEFRERALRLTWHTSRYVIPQDKQAVCFPPYITQQLANRNI